jgi:REP element-mobilizing transposase RayT
MSGIADEEIQFYDPQALKEVYRRHLPHWSQAGRIYCVTFRLADSIPAARAAELSRERQAWCKVHPEPYTPSQWHEYHMLFSARIEQWLDRCCGSCLLADPACAQIVVGAMESHDGQGYQLDQWVIMPNHVHVLVTPNEGFSLEEILQGWKSITSDGINRHLSRHGQLWQRESFDHIVRSLAHLDRFRQYIRDNPARAGRFRHLCRLRSS